MVEFDNHNEFEHYYRSIELALTVLHNQFWPFGSISMNQSVKDYIYGRHKAFEHIRKGLIYVSPLAKDKKSIDQMPTVNFDLSDKAVINLIEKRDKLRKEKQWQASDTIRDFLVDFGIEINDGVDQSTWRRK